MILYIREIQNQKLYVFVSVKLYNENTQLFNSVFSTFQIGNKEAFPNEHSDNILFIHSNEETLNPSAFQHISCDTSNSQWKYWMIFDLESWLSNSLNCTVLHAGSLELCGKNIILLANSMCGKTTLLYYLCKNKSAKYLDDDSIYLINNSFYGFNFPIALRNNLDKNNEDTISFTDDAVMKNRKLVMPREKVNKFEKTDLILFPKYSPLAENFSKKIQGAELFSSIMNNVRASKNISSLYNDIRILSKNSIAYEIHYSNSENAYKLINDILALGI